MSTVQSTVLSVSKCVLDSKCKSTLATMLRNGWDKPHTLYLANHQVIAPSELSHLLTHGGLILPGGPISTLHSYISQKLGAPGHGAEVGFTLNVELTP